MNAKFAIGTTYRSRHRFPRVCTVTDILRTYNSAGALVAIRYVSEHEFIGQIVRDGDVLETTIAMGNPSPPAAVTVRPSGAARPRRDTK